MLEAVYKAAPQVAPEWPGSGWLTRIEGKPSITLDVDHWIGSGLLATAMHAVHAIPAVVAAPPGIRTFLDLPLIVGRHTVARRLSGAGGRLARSCVAPDTSDPSEPGSMSPRAVCLG